MLHSLNPVSVPHVPRYETNECCLTSVFVPAFTVGYIKNPAVKLLIRHHCI